MLWQLIPPLHNPSRCIYLSLWWFAAPCSSTAEHLGTMLETGPIGRMVDNPRSCHESANPDFNYFRSVDIEQMWWFLHSARIPALFQEKGQKVWAKNLECTKFLWGIIKDTHKRFVPLWRLHWSTRFALEQQFYHRYQWSVLCCSWAVLSFKPGSLEQNTKHNVWSKTCSKIVKRKPVQLTC